MHGHCLCGEVRFSLAPPWPQLYQCHCSQCRKLSGSASDTALFIDRRQFQWQQGEDNIRHYQTPTGFRSDFCATCGSTVPHLMSNGRQCWVPAGLLDAGYPGRVVAHLFVDSRSHWDVIGDTGRQYGEMPEMSELNALLQQGEASG